MLDIVQNNLELISFITLIIIWSYLGNYNLVIPLATIDTLEMK